MIAVEGGHPTRDLPVSLGFVLWVHRLGLEDPWPRLLQGMSPLAPLAMGSSVGHMGSGTIRIRTFLNVHVPNDSHNEPRTLRVLEQSRRLSISTVQAARVGVPRARSRGRGGERRSRDCVLVLCRAGAVRGPRERFGQHV